MTLLKFQEQVKELIREWLDKNKIKVDKVPLEKPPREEHGELSTSLPFMLSKKIGKNPFEVARKMSEDIKPKGLIGKVQAAKPGYVNFYVDFSKLAFETVRSILMDGDRYGRLDLGKGKKVQVEYASVNPNKALHIGHARNVCLGCALANILSYAGYKVERINYINDLGAQMADLMFGFLELGFSTESYSGRFDQYCGDEVYVSATKALEERPELAEKRARIAKEMENPQSKISKMTRKIAERVVRDQLRTCWRLGAEFDALVWESDILGVKLWERTFEILKKSDLIVYETEGKNKGCWVFKLTKIPKYSKETDKILVKSDGTKTYIAKDISFAMWKLGLLPSPLKFSPFTVQPSGITLWSTMPNGVRKDFGSADISINVIDVRQKRLQDAIKMILSTIYGEEYGRKYIHYAYEVVSLSKETVKKYLGVFIDKKFLHMSGRKGLYVNVDPILDFMKNMALRESLRRNKDIKVEEAEKMAEKIAVASLKYPLISADLDKIVIFDVDKALDITEESGAYILYGYARASKILEKANFRPKIEDFDPSEVKAVEEMRLIKQMASFPLEVKASAEKLIVKNLARYMYDLTLYFNKFYEKCPVLSESSKVRNNRLLIVECYVKLMEILSKLLAIPLAKRV